MELSRDFISTFPSAREEDRIRPLHSIMRTSTRVCKLRLPNDNLAFSQFHPEDRRGGSKASSNHTCPHGWQVGYQRF